MQDMSTKYEHDEDDEPGLNVEELREQAHREREIARLLGPSDTHEARWLNYLDQLVTITETYIEQTKANDADKLV